MRCRLVESAGAARGLVVVLFHGFGAPGTDLVPLASEIEAPPGTTFVFPEAPLALPWGYDARAWWMIDMTRLERAIASGSTSTLPDEIPPGLPPVREHAVALVGELEARLGIAPDRVVLGGFSQGSMVALDAALHLVRPPGGLALMSSTLLSTTEWGPLMTRLSRRPVLLSHGTHDPLLPFGAAGRLRDMLIDAGADVRWRPFPGQHEIPRAAIDGVSTLLADLG